MPPPTCLNALTCGDGRLPRVSAHVGQVFDTHIFPSLADLADRTRVFGYYGGLRLLRATCKRFVDRVADTCKVDLSAGCRISYDSNIPFGAPALGHGRRQCGAPPLTRVRSRKNKAPGHRMTAVGLAGSSAIVTAAFRALMRYYGVTLDMLRLTRDEVRAGTQQGSRRAIAAVLMIPPVAALLLANAGAGLDSGHRARGAGHRGRLAGPRHPRV